MTTRHAPGNPYVTDDDELLSDSSWDVAEPDELAPDGKGVLVPVFTPVTSAGKYKIRLADLVKVGPEGYIHGWICVRPPCGAYIEPFRDTHGGRVIHQAAGKMRVIGRDMKKLSGDAGYRIRYQDPETGEKVTLGGQYASRADAAKAVALYHNARVLEHEARQRLIGDAREHTMSAREALEHGHHNEAARLLSRVASENILPVDIMSHTEDLSRALRASPLPVNEPDARPLTPSEQHFADVTHAARQATREQLQHALESGVEKRAVPRVRGSIGATSIITFNDGSKWVRKDLSGFHADADEINREEAASLVARALGTPAPDIINASVIPGFMPYDDIHPDLTGSPVNPAHDQVLMMPFIHGKTFIESGDDSSDLMRAGDTKAGSELRKVALLDKIIANRDRHDGNIMIDGDDNVYPIDHGFSWNGGRLTSHLGTILKPGMLDEAYLQQSRENLLALRPDIENLIGPDRMDDTLYELDKFIHETQNESARA